jgi:1-acyl-sn-glycerol-3-phosphate acyltransferase
MRHALRQAFRVFTTGGAFLTFFTGGALLGWVVLPVVTRLTRDPAVAARRCRRIVRRSWILFHDVLRLLGVLDYDPRRVDVVLPEGACVLVANHPTLLDATAIAAALPDLTMVAKREMYRKPLLGQLLRHCGFVEVDDRSPFAGVGAASGCLDRLAAGVPVLVFPEGTRSPRSGLGPFHPGAFALAGRAGVPVVPLLLRCEPPTLHRGDAWYDVPPRTPRMTLEMLSRPCPAGPDPSELAHRLREAYARRLGDELAAS